MKSLLIADLSVVWDIKISFETLESMCEITGVVLWIWGTFLHLLFINPNHCLGETTEMFKWCHLPFFFPVMAKIHNRYQIKKISSMNLLSWQFLLFSPHILKSVCLYMSSGCLTIHYSLTFLDQPCATLRCCYFRKTVAFKQCEWVFMSVFLQLHVYKDLKGSVFSTCVCLWFVLSGRRSGRLPFLSPGLIVLIKWVW